MRHLPQLQLNAVEKLRPRKPLSGSQWAKENAWFSPEDSLIKQRYTDSMFPFQGEILDAMCDPEISDVVAVLASQTGKTSMCRITQGYYIDYDPAPMIMSQPTLALAETYSKDRFAPFCRDTPAMQGKVKDSKQKDSGNTILHKEFPGGHITFVGANTASSAASRPIRVVMQDEISRYPISVSKEGDFSDLLDRRSARFWNSKRIKISTPTNEGLCRITLAYNESDQRRFMVPCPECGKRQWLKWKQFVFDRTKLNEIHYRCEYCTHDISQKEKFLMIRAGKFEAHSQSRITGFHVSEFYVLTTDWAEIAEDFLKVHKNPERLQVLVNTRFAETFENKGDAPDHLHIYARREYYKRSSIPDGVLFLTASVDTQLDRLEVEIKGWGRNDGENWSIDHIVFMGDTSSQEVFKKLDELLVHDFYNSNGAVFRIKGLGIDTGGTAGSTQSVYFWCRTQSPNVVYALKGMPLDIPVGIPKAVDVDYQGRRFSNGLKLWGVGVSLIKSELYSRLKKQRGDDGVYPAGYAHFPDYDEEFFRQLTAESQKVKEKNGRKYIFWAKHYTRNEALDLSVYNRAVAIILGIDRLSLAEWNQLEIASVTKPVQAIIVQKQKVVQSGRRQLNKGLERD